MSFRTVIKHAWDALNDRNGFVTDYNYVYIGPGNSKRPDRIAMTRGRERSLITAVYNRIALDCSMIDVEHVRLDDQGRYLTTIQSGLNDCFNLQANKDQSGMAFIQDVVLSMFDEGDVAIVPTQTSVNVRNTEGYDIQALRTAKIEEWYPDHVKLRIYDDEKGKFVSGTWPKSKVAIIENPFKVIMNEPNSTINRLTRKLALLDAIDEESGAGKLDLIIQLPYAVKGKTREEQAEKRRKALQDQLKDGKYGVAYTDGTEHVIQLNRPIENNLMKQIEYLFNLAYAQLGITTGIMDGSADSNTMMNYEARIIGVIMTTIVNECRRKFLSKTARSQKQSIMFFKDPFRIIPMDKLADIADKFTRNEILTSNELRQIIGRKPSQDPEADVLRNKNLNKSANEMMPPPTSGMGANGGQPVDDEIGYASQELRNMMERKNNSK